MWNPIRSLLAFSLFCILITTIANTLGEMETGVLTYWNINTGLMLLFVLLCLLTSRRIIKLWQKLLYWISAFIVHIILTIPAAAILGVLMYDENHVRTSGEHRAIFFIAALPIVIYAMWNSKLFVKEIVQKRSPSEDFDE